MTKLHRLTVATKISLYASVIHGPYEKWRSGPFQTTHIIGCQEREFGNAIIHGGGRDEPKGKGKKKKKIRGEKMYECIYTLIHSIVPREIQLVKITIIKRKLGKLSWG